MIEFVCRHCGSSDIRGTKTALFIASDISRDTRGPNFLSWVDDEDDALDRVFYCRQCEAESADLNDLVIEADKFRASEGKAA